MNHSTVVLFSMCSAVHRASLLLTNKFKLCNEKGIQTVCHNHNSTQ